jgi:transposase
MCNELHTFATTLLPQTHAVHLTQVTIEKASIQLYLTATAPTEACPLCCVPSSSIHSGYQRHMTDLSWGTHAVRIHLTVRKFVCRNPSCERRIFTERLPDLVATFARHTTRFVTVLQALGIALGGNAGAQLAARLRLSTSPSTLLHLVRAAPVPCTPALQAVRVDEWAWRRGHRYGTILVDLATHRAAATVAAWLAQYPTITVVCRDRSDLYAEGIRQGLPNGVQVVDRFHLVHNLRQALESFLINHRSTLQAAATGMATALTPTDSPLPVTPMYRGRRRSVQPQPQQQAEGPPRHARWGTIYETLHTRHVQGTPVATIARQLGISRPTVYAYLWQDTPPGPKRPSGGHRRRC